MTADSRLSRAVPFPEFGPDHVLRFTTGDLIALESSYSVKDDALGADPWTKEIERRLQANDATFVREAVKLGVKKPGGFARPEMKDHEWDDLPFSPAAVTQKLADAILCAITGRAYADILQDREAAEGAAAQAA
ncbi:hypothetical protein ACFZ8E_06265 [Methylobacterium sp. HMF5984]|uniref:hypothetical protein n=1 Tax=Methylobacterium sp. HMF5984 TaxID=3367370 RepID=UPI0038547552